jgi:hypothetical protein
MKLPGNGK